MVFLFIPGCESAAEPIITFVVPKGDHYAYPKAVESLQSRTLAFEVMFDETANGERFEKFVGVVGLNEFNHYKIEIEQDHYAFILNDEAPVSRTWRHL